VLLYESLNFVAPESCDLSEADARQKWPPSRGMIVHPRLANTQPFGNLANRQQTVRAIRLG